MCKKCDTIQPTVNFPKDKKMKLGHLNSCKGCENKANKEERLKNIDKVLAKDKEYRMRNKEKVNAKARKSYYKNIEKNRQRSLEYFHDNEEACRARSRKWRKDNREYRISYEIERYHNDLQTKIKCVMAARMRHALKDQKMKKNDRTPELMGCSFNDLIKYIESKFLVNMSWENYGKYIVGQPMTWHIDHIRPCASFDLSDTEQQKACFHYTNLQPLWAIDNIIKKDSINYVN